MTSLQKKKDAYAKITSTVEEIIKNGLPEKTSKFKMFLDNNPEDFDHLLGAIKANYGDFVMIRQVENKAYMSFSKILGLYIDIEFDNGALTFQCNFIEFFLQEGEEDFAFDAPLQVKRFDDKVVVPTMIVHELCSLGNDIPFSSIISGFIEASEIPKPVCKCVILSLETYNELVKRYLGAC